MQKSELHEWIHNARQQGYTIEQLRVYLKAHGYTLQQIDAAIQEHQTINPPVHQYAQTQNSKPHQKVTQNKPKNNPVENLHFWDRVKYIFSNPKKLFEEIKTETTIKRAFITYIIFSASVSTITFLIFSLLLIPLMIGESFSAGIINVIGIGFIVFFTIGVGLTFLYAAILNALVKAFKGGASFIKSYNIYIYSTLVVILFSPIPYVNLGAFIYSIILLIIGVAKVHDLSYGKAATIIVLTFILMLALFTAIIAVIIFLIIIPLISSLTGNMGLFPFL